MAIDNLRSFMSHFRTMPIFMYENNELAAAVTEPSNNGLLAAIRQSGPATMLEKITSVERKCLAGDSKATPVYLICNDYENGETEFDMLELLKQRGHLPDSLGIQLHMTQGEWPLERIDYLLKRLGRYGKPVFVTEISVLSGDHKWVQPNAVENNGGRQPQVKSGKLTMWKNYTNISSATDT